MSSESRSLRTEMLLKRFSFTIEKFEKRLLDLKPREINHVRRPLPTKLNITAVAADRLMKRKTKSSDKKEDCAVNVVRRVSAKSCESNGLPADNALLIKRQKLEKDLFCPITSDKTEGRALVRRVAAIDHKPVCRPPFANEGLAAGRRVAAKSCECNALPADNALLIKRQKLEKDLFCPITSDKTEGRALVRRVAAIDHKPVCRPPSANEGRAAGRRVAAKSCESNALPADNALLMRKRRNELEMKRKNLKRREAIQKKREAARRELEQMRNTAGIYDPSELVHNLENMLGYSITGHMPQPALPLPAYYKSLIKTDDMICCCDQDKKKVEEVEEGEIID